MEKNIIFAWNALSLWQFVDSFQPSDKPSGIYME